MTLKELLEDELRKTRKEWIEIKTKNFQESEDSNRLLELTQTIFRIRGLLNDKYHK